MKSPRSFGYAGALRESLRESAIQGGTAASTATVWPSLLVVDNDRHMLHALVCFFEQRGFHVAAATSLAEAKTFLHDRKTWTLVLADYHLPDGTGDELRSWVREKAEATPVLLMSGSANVSALCGTQHLAKPFPLETLECRVQELLRR